MTAKSCCARRSMLAAKNYIFYIFFMQQFSHSQGYKGHSHSLTTPPQASMHQQDGPLDATERIFGTTAENELA
jgi:hypothetical protein